MGNCKSQKKRGNSFDDKENTNNYIRKKYKTKKKNKSNLKEELKVGGILDISEKNKNPYEKD